MLEHELIVGDIDLLDLRKVDGFKLFAQLLLLVVPEHDPVTLEDMSQGLVEFLFHTESFRLLLRVQLCRCAGAVSRSRLSSRVIGPGSLLTRL